MTRKLKEEDRIGNPIFVRSHGGIVCSLLLLFTILLNRVDAFALPIGIAATNNIKYSSKGLFSSTADDGKRLTAYGMEYSYIPTQLFHTVIRSKGRRHSTLLFDKNHEDDETKHKASSPPLPIIDSFSMTNLFPDADFLRVREDATLASCYGLCRFLIYDITTGSKDVPGWQLSDFIMLGGAFSSCIVLSTLWTVVGLIVGVFNNRGDTGGEGDDSNGMFDIPLTAIIVGPLWLLIEIGLGWPPGGSLSVNEFSASGADSVTSVIYTIITGSIGLGSIMWLSKGWQ